MNRFQLLSALLLLLVLVACQPATNEPSDKVASETPAPQASAKCVVDPPAESGICTMDWNPVCGCDGKTYSNACMAKAAGVSEFTPGECDKPADR